MTDHKPLISLLNEKRQIPAQAAPRIMRWALTLAAYEYTIKFKPSVEYAIADGFSRLPLKERQQKVSNTPIPEEYVLLLNYISKSPITCSQLAKWTKADPLLSQVMHWVDRGWPNTAQQNNSLKSFCLKKEEMSTLQGCLVWSNLVVISEAGRALMLQELHRSHQGAASMKRRARACMWWPGIGRNSTRM